MKNAKKYANYYGHSDVYPYEVIRIVSDKTIVVRGMNAEKDPTWKPKWIKGGFSGHCVNNHLQRWIITSDETLSTWRIRLHKDGVWRDRNGGKYYLTNTPRCFYDYNH